MKQSIVRIFAIFALALVALGFVSVGASGQASAQTLQKQVATQASIPQDCTPYVTGNTLAWGYGGWLYLNQCALDRIQSIAGGNITTGAAIIIGYKYPYASLFIGAAYVYFGAMQWMSSSCNGRGVFLVRSGAYVWAMRAC